MRFRVTGISLKGKVHRLIALCCTLSLIVLLPMTGLAAADLYTVAVSLDPEITDEREARRAAEHDALQLVLIRVTGSDDEEHLVELAGIFPNPTRYVLRYRSGQDDTLEISFDGNAIEKLLRQTRHTIWGDDRPLTLILLAVDWGDGNREIIGSESGQQSPDVTRSIDRHRLLRERVLETAQRRGIPVVFPLLDIEDQQNIRFSDIWGGFEEPLIDASRRYGASSILVGRVRPGGSQENRWTYIFGEDQLQWTGGPEVAISQVADELAAHFAIQGDAVLQSYSLTIDGIDSLVAYGQVQQLMDNLGVAEAYSLTIVAGQKVEYQVRIYGGIDRLNKALELSGILHPSLDLDDDFRELTDTDPDYLEFVYLP